MRIVVLGLSITSSWGNGHATNYRALVRAMEGRGHEVLFLERDVPWYAAQRDLPDPPWGRTALYSSLGDLRRRHAADVGAADLLIVGSYVPDGVEVARWALGHTDGVTAFYDIDTPVTIAKLETGDDEYLAAADVPRFDLYLSFTGGPALDRLRDGFGARRPLAFYCFADPERHRPVPVPMRWDLGYLGTYSEDRQDLVGELLVEPARRRPDRAFAVAGAQYPDGIAWPENTSVIEHVPAERHPEFYCAQRFTLNVTRAPMRRAGWSPSVRLFEAAACAVPVISDRWDGLEAVFTPGAEILVADRAEDVVAILTGTSETERRRIGERARQRVLAEHTAEHRVAELEHEVLRLRSPGVRAA